MGNIATSIDEQINLLQKRGLIIDDLDKAKETLLDIGYYRLGFYWHHFYNTKKEEFTDNVNFKDVTDLYYFDTELRFLLTQYLTRIEINFRTKVVYYISNKYKNSPTWFVDPKVLILNLLKVSMIIITKILKRLMLLKTITENILMISMLRHGKH